MLCNYQRHLTAANDQCLSNRAICRWCIIIIILFTLQDLEINKIGTDEWINHRYDFYIKINVLDPLEQIDLVLTLLYVQIFALKWTIFRLQ